MPSRSRPILPIAESGFCNKWGEEQAVFCQHIVFLGLALNSSQHVFRETSFRVCLALLRLSRTVRLGLCLRLFRLMASAILVVQLGHLYEGLSGLDGNAQSGPGASRHASGELAMPVVNSIVPGTGGPHAGHPVQEGVRSHQLYSLARPW